MSRELRNMISEIAGVERKLRRNAKDRESSTLTRSLCDVGNMTFCNFLLFSMYKSLNVVVNKCIN